MINNNLRAITSSICYKAILIVIIISYGMPTYAQVKASKHPETDTFKIVNRFIAKKKFARANKLLKKYSAAHPQNLNSLWLQAQVNLFTNNNKRSNSLYGAAIKLAPKNDYLKLDYIHSLAEMGKTDFAGNMLYQMENSGSDYSDIALLHARLCYYNGDYEEAAAYMKKALQSENQNPEASNLNDQIEIARSPKISLNASYLSDNQPLNILGTSVKFEQYYSRFLSLTVTGYDYHFLQNTTSDAPWLGINNKMFFPDAGLHLNYGAGIMRFPAGNKTSFTGELNLNKKISSLFDLDLGVDHIPYFGTRASVDTTISVTQFSANLNFHKNNWLAQAAFLDYLYQDNNNVYSAYAWFLAPIVVFPTGKLQAGLSTSYSNSNENKYQSVNSLDEILNTYTPGSAIAGAYNPYFTPNEEYITAALISFNLKASKKIDIYVSGDVGYGSILNPYLYLDKNSAGVISLVKGYSTEYFTPYDASFALNYHIDKTWLLTGKYTYRSTYFFNSNYVTVGIEKSFLHQTKGTKLNDKKSAFSKEIQEIEDKLSSLYRCKNRDDLKQSVGNIKTQILAVRDAFQKKINMTELTPGSEKSELAHDKINSLNEMINEINAVNLDDRDNDEDKREWLVNKLYDLTSIHYDGPLDEQ